MDLGTSSVSVNDQEPMRSRSHATTDGAGGQVKKRAACDECRTKKLKCTGEHPACSRCVRECITCVYSPQKQMGRPKKRRRTSSPEGVALHDGISNLAVGQTTIDSLGSAKTNGNYIDDPLDLSIFDNAFSPGGTFNLMPSRIDWEHFATQDGFGGLSSFPPAQLPELTPDTSHNSTPPTLNLPPELQDTRPRHHNHGQSSNAHSYSDSYIAADGTISYPAGLSTAMLLDPSSTNSFTNSNSQALNGHNSNSMLQSTNASISSLLDPNDDSNLGLPPHMQSSCACISTLYLQITGLSNLEKNYPNFSFPFVLHPLRKAMQTALETIKCQECPRRFITAISNTQLIGTLIIAIAERFCKVLTHITKEAVRAEEEGEEKRFRLSDLNTSTSHLHTGGLGCAAAFDIHLSPSDWRKMAKKVIMAEVYGEKHGNDCCVSYVQLLDGLENRHTHYANRKLPDDFPVDHTTGLQMGGNNIPKDDHLCLKYVEVGKKLMEKTADWS